MPLMSVQQLLNALFNLGAQTDFWNSGAAARDFWISFAILIVLVAGAFAVRNSRPHRTPRLRHHH
jgi:hypothetical protein